MLNENEGLNENEELNEIKENELEYVVGGYMAAGNAALYKAKCDECGKKFASVELCVNHKLIEHSKN